MSSIETRQLKVAVKPVHIVSGLGSANREFLALSLSLFEDSALTKLMVRLYKQSLKKLEKNLPIELSDSAKEFESRRDYWMKPESGTDDELRNILWIKLRDAFGLPPKLTGTVAGAERLADDLAAAMIHVISPPPGISDRISSRLRPLLEKIESPTQKKWAERFLKDDNPAITLSGVVEPVLEEILAGYLKNATEEELTTLLDKVVDEIGKLSKEDQERIRKELKIDDINRDSLLKILMSAGGLSAILTAVSMAGFTAYILAAQASAFIPLVSGPGLVSFLYVISNPITAIGGTIAAGWWFSNSATKAVKAIIATRVIAFLAIQGLKSGTSGTSDAVLGFSRMSRLQPNHELKDITLNQYKQERTILSQVMEAHAGPPSREFSSKMDRPVVDGIGRLSDALKDGGALSAMTAGEMLYSYYSIDPSVIAAADFAYMTDVTGPLELSQLAEGMSEGALIRLKGYVAEQIVAINLASQGHTVMPAAEANEPGWDLLVDGQKVQVKFRDGLDGIIEHFDKYDYPVIANYELMGKIPAEYEDRVLFIDGVTNELVTDITDKSIDAADQLGDPSLPTMALLLSLYRGGKSVLNREVSASQATEQIIIDGSVRIGLIGIGKLAGVGVGALVFGPAGAWVFGPGLPILLQTQTGSIIPRVKQSLSSKQKAWNDLAHNAIDQFIDHLIQVFKSKRAMLAHQFVSTETNELGSYLKWKLKDELQYVKEQEVRFTHTTSRHHFTDAGTRFKELLRQLAASTIHPVCYQKELRELSEVIASRPSLIDKQQLKDLLRLGKGNNTDDSSNDLNTKP